MKTTDSENLAKVKQFLQIMQEFFGNSAKELVVSTMGVMFSAEDVMTPAGSDDAEKNRPVSKF